MKRAALAALVLCWAGGAAAASRPPLYDPVSLNTGLSCQWQKKCVQQQQRAMKRALAYVKRKSPPSWRIHLCNRNASRRSGRVDWVGFNNCIRNAALRPPPPRAARPRSKRR
jgi:hypothetical protein